MTTRYVIGIDEVGRGPLAGSLTVAAVAAPQRSYTNGAIKKLLNDIKDSKKLSSKQREKWRKIILAEKSFFASVVSVRSFVIDRIGMARATRLAVSKCLWKLENKNASLSKDQIAHIFLDGSLYAPPSYLNQQTIIKGDEKIPLIAAASIVAKVHRDRAMQRLAKKFPQYQFHLHKGYGTALHRSLIQKHGLSSIHRVTFCSRFMPLHDKL